MTPAQIAATLKKKGTAMTLTRTGAGTFDPATGGVNGGAVSTYIVYGLILSFDLSDINAANSLIQSGDEKLMINAGIVQPLPGDSITVDNETYSVISVKRKRPQGVGLFYYCQVRK